MALIAVITMTACKSTKKATEGSSTAKSETEAQLGSAPIADSLKADLYRLTVSFYSIGSGTENEFITGFEDKIGSFAGKVGKNIDYEKSHWGREGETDFCLRLTELSKAEQDEFITMTRNYLKDAKWVHINENQLCRHKGKR